MSYLDDLARELARRGIRGRRARRIWAEIADHLACDPQADLGPAAQLADQFADELGTSLVRQAAWTAFGALAAAGCLFAVAAISLAPDGQGWASVRFASPVLGAGAAGVAVLAAQVALAAGLLAPLRAFRLRRSRVVAEAEAQLIARRAGVGLIAGASAMIAVLGLALEVKGLPSARLTLSVAAASAGGGLLLAAALPLEAAYRVRPSGPGAAGDVFSDLGRLVPAPVSGRPWRLALLLAAAIVVVVSAAGVLQDDPYDGILRGIADATACLAGFALLGRYLGLRA